MDDRPRPVARPKSGDSRHSSFSGRLDELKRYPKVPTEDDIASVDRGLRIRGLSDGPKSRNKISNRRTTGSSSESSSEKVKQGTGRRRKVDRRAILVTEFPSEKNGMGAVEIPIAT